MEIHKCLSNDTVEIQRLSYSNNCNTGDIKLERCTIKSIAMPIWGCFAVWISTQFRIPSRNFIASHSKSFLFTCHFWNSINICADCIILEGVAQYIVICLSKLYVRNGLDLLLFWKALGDLWQLALRWDKIIFAWKKLAGLTIEIWCKSS
jgi:hypothetical protein